MPQRKKKFLGYEQNTSTVVRNIYIIPGGSVLDDTNLMGENMNTMTEAESILGVSKEVRLGRIAQN
jgi:hypothetical protein